jgi:hypothetical protein
MHMPTIARHHRRSTARRRSGSRPGASTQTQLARTRRSGGPTEDRALYRCGCGHAFTAAVSTSVGCPSCGETQAW